MDDKELLEAKWHYSREKRLEKASQKVRALNAENTGKRPPLLKTMVPNKATAFLLLAIVLLVLTIMFTRLLNLGEKQSFLNSEFTIKAQAIEGQTQFNIKRKSLKRPYVSSPFTLSIQGSNDEIRLVRSMVISPLAEEEYQFSIDGRAESFLLLFMQGQEHLLLQARVE